MNAKDDRRTSIGWWAPGEYYCICRNCDCSYVGDKRSGHCADCAYELAKEKNPPQLTPEPPWLKVRIQEENRRLNEMRSKGDPGWAE